MGGKYWEHRRVLITGSGGFIGSRLLEYFIGKKARVLGLNRKPTRRGREKKVDVTDRKAVAGAIQAFSPDVCFHLASRAVVEAGQLEPYETFRNNIVSTLNVLEACRNAGVRRIVIASSVHVYGDAPFPYAEDEPARPSRPYETSKTCADLVAQSYADTFKLPVLIPRFVNIYGPGDHNLTRIIPKTITSLLRGEPPTLWGGNSMRDYLYIGDALSAYDMLARVSDQQLGKNRIYNFAVGNPVSAKTLIEMIIRLMNTHQKIKNIPSVRANELLRQDVNWNKARRILGWTPKTDLSTGLLATIAWFENEHSQRR